jgi:glycerol-3-phosphate acyltransferase PlsY
MDRLIAALVLSYLIGSIPFSQIIAMLVKGVDLRAVGSRNVGGNNLIASAGTSWGIIGGGLDAAKGVAAMWLAQTLGAPYPWSLLCGLFAVGGHNWSPWLGFRGGKGIATGLGVLGFVSWPEAVIATLIFAAMNWRFIRNGTTATIISLVSLGVLYLITGKPLEFFLLGFGIAGLIYIASYNDLVATSKSAKHWTENFTIPK